MNHAGSGLPKQPGYAFTEKRLTKKSIFPCSQGDPARVRAVCKDSMSRRARLSSAVVGGRRTLLRHASESEFISPLAHKRNNIRDVFFK